MINPNINRINIIFYPLMYFTVLGISNIIDRNIYIKTIVIFLYIISFVFFLVTYFLSFNTIDNLKEPIEFLSKFDDKQIYITNTIHEPYIYVLFYNKINTHDFVNTVKYKRKDVEFRPVESFNNYHFEEILEIDENSDKVYLINNSNLQLLKNVYNEINVKKFNNYSIIY